MTKTQRYMVLKDFHKCLSLLLMCTPAKCYPQRYAIVHTFQCRDRVQRASARSALHAEGAAWEGGYIPDSCKMAWDGLSINVG